MEFEFESDAPPPPAPRVALGGLWPRRAAPCRRAVELGGRRLYVAGEVCRSVALRRTALQLPPGLTYARAYGAPAVGDNACAPGRFAVAAVVALALGSVQAADAAGKDDDSFVAHAPFAAENNRRVSASESDEESDEESNSSRNEAPLPQRVLSKYSHAKALKTPSGAKADGCALITSFFSVKRKRGRKTLEGTAGPKPKRGRPPRAAGDAKVVKTSSPPKLGEKTVEAAAPSRTNWSKGANLVKLRAAVQEWDCKSARCTTSTSQANFAKLVDIPLGTLKNYIQDDLSQRRKLGVGVGKPSIISVDKQKFMVDVVRRRDRGNDGLSNAAVVEALGELVPTTSRDQIRQSWRRTILPGFKSTLTGLVVAQPTTTKRTAITVAQQWRWHRLMDDTLKKLRLRNDGLCPKTNKSFGEVRQAVSLLNTSYLCSTRFLLSHFSYSHSLSFFHSSLCLLLLLFVLFCIHLLFHYLLLHFLY